jgi:selenocysteine lyase/cysteine desulfurase
MAELGIECDARGRYLRFGPAPYTTSAEIDRAMAGLSEIL